VVSWILLTLPPILVALGECLLLATYAHFTWSMAVYHALKNSVAWHLAFWEWVGSAAVFLFLISSALFLPEHAYA
jgi:chromate transport protein ChrA